MRFTVHRSDTNQSRLVEILRARGFQVKIIGRPFDLLIARAGKMAFAEVKDPRKQGWKNEFTDQQKKFLQGWEGPKVHVLRSDSDAFMFEIE